MDYRKLTSALLKHGPVRSEPFLQGMAAVLQNRVDGTLVTSPYSDGRPENDAFLAGRMRAHNEFRNLLLEANGNREAAIARMHDFAETRRAA